uniref:Glycosyltransferase 2-like domain-containing protein n=1 Tax=Hucho hucho TaxID=62062 RepID=A0A4W5KSL9_9TELE
MQKNLVSIITPSFNSEKFIAETIVSVQNQTHINWEMIIVDDCSTDHTASIVERFIKNDGRIHLFRLDKNLGAGIARDIALSKAKGDYIAFLDADDLWKRKPIRCFYHGFPAFFESEEYLFLFRWCP